jgi:murein DD-endopeptidase MepM/ murein hydrolase activator NlpD
VNGLHRLASLHTIIPSRPRQKTISYTVQFGDSVFGIAEKFNLKPETVLWANYDTLNDNPDLLKPGIELNIPPVDGVYYQWKEGDTLEAVAEKFEADVEDILSWPGNDLDLIQPEIEVGQWLMIPSGHREYRQWVVPTIPRGAAGVSRSVYGAGACSGSYEGAYGTGTFTWPTTNHYLSGNDYWSGHLAIDIAAGEGMGIMAADNGVVVFSGWATGGYGYMIMIDHGNGYQTLYAHLSQVNVVCGQSVYQGQLIGLAGSTGNSTGPHLHFEVRYMGGFINPWYVLPAP